MAAITLLDIPPEVLCTLAEVLSCCSIGRMACVSRAALAVFGSEAAFVPALCALTGSNLSLSDRIDLTSARDRVRSATLLDGRFSAWAEAPIGNDSPLARHHHAAFVHEHTLIVAFGTVMLTYNTNEAWAFDLRKSVWTQACADSGDAPHPGSRSFGADLGGCGGVLHDANGSAWLVTFGGSRPGVRDNETVRRRWFHR